MARASPSARSTQGSLSGPETLRLPWDHIGQKSKLNSHSRQDSGLSDLGAGVTALGPSLRREAPYQDGEKERKRESGCPGLVFSPVLQEKVARATDRQESRRL